MPGRPVPADAWLRQVLAAAELSWRAKGIYAYGLTLPPRAVLTRALLFTHGAEPIEAVDHALAELLGLGLAREARRQRGTARQHGGITLTSPRP
jgi:hypothetical protein